MSERARTSATRLLTATTVLPFVLASASAQAVFTPDELDCRQTISKNGLKLGQIAVKVFRSCHKKRAKGKLPATTDCNSEAGADAAGKIAKIGGKLVPKVVERCDSFVPSDLLYIGCPAPCDATVPALDDFTDVGNCLQCVVTNAAMDLSSSEQGAPLAPMATLEGKCHDTIGKSYSKHHKTLLKERVRCQNGEESAGATNTSTCTGADPRGKILKAASRGGEKIAAKCNGADLDDVDSCSTFSVPVLQNCVFSRSDFYGDEMFQAFYGLNAGAGATTTTTSMPGGTTTTTTMGGGGDQDPFCPSIGEVVIMGGTGATSCTTNGDCPSGQECDNGLSLCTSLSELDTGWTGIAHDADINDLVKQRARLLCPGPFDGAASEPCGDCTVLGLLAETRDCRCDGDNRTVCDEPFVADNDDCGGAVCNCYLGPPLPLSAGNTPACSVNRFSSDVTGTANVDLGQGQVTANLAAVAYLGINLVLPCPACGGTCTAPPAKVGNVCGVDADCETSPASADGVCGNYDDMPKDGVRNGTCIGGVNNGEACDVDAYNSSFPAPGPSGAGMSLDCFPDPGKNVSGTGLKIGLTQTTGTSALPPASITCGFPPFVTYDCPCGQCSNDTSIPCSTDAQCSGGTCVSDGNGAPLPDQCSTTTDCIDIGGGEGQCNGGPSDKLCDGIVRADGSGFISCLGNADCEPGVIGLAAGACTLTKTRKCFLDPITATGTPDPVTPVAVASFCIGKTSNGGINTVAGLPGPARVKNQADAKTFCDSDPNTQYVPGVGGCP